MITNFLSLDKMIKAGTRPNYLVLLSTDVIGFNNTIKLYKSAMEFPDVNFIELDGETIDFDTLINAIEKYPLMDFLSVVLVTKANFITTNGKDKNKILKSLNKLTIPRHCTLILQTYINEEENLKKNTKIPKLEAQGAMVIYSPKFTFLEGQGELQKRNINLDKDTTSFIYQKCGNNLDIFMNECEKISMLPKEKITPQLLNSVISKTVINSVFDIIDVLIKNKDLKEAFNILDNLIEKGTQPLEIFGALHSQIKLMYYAKQFSTNEKSSEDLAKEFKLHPFRAKIGFNQANLFTLEKLAKLFIYCNDVSKNLKLSSNPKIELEKIIIKMFN